MKYPTDMVTDDGWLRIHEGHNLSREALEYDLRERGHARPDGTELHVDEWHLGYAPRVKWCAQYGWPCDQEGEWHGHWYHVQPNDRSAFTAVSWQPA